jgi:hypothetical protein
MQAKGATPDDIQSMLARDDVVVAANADRWFEGSARMFDGPAGRSFCVDGYGLHRAMVPETRPRLLLWFRFGNFFNEVAYRVSFRNGRREDAERTLARIPQTPRHQYVFRYLIGSSLKRLVSWSGRRARAIFNRSSGAAGR